jgi:hypothetical protein
VTVSIPISIEKVLSSAGSLTPVSYMTSCTWLDLIYTLVTHSLMFSVNLPYTLLTFLFQLHVHFPLPRLFQRIHSSPRLCVIFCTKVLCYSEKIAPFPSPMLEVHPLFTVHTAYSIYSQLPSISGGHLLHLQPKDMPSHCDRGTHDMVSYLLNCTVSLTYGYATNDIWWPAPVCFTHVLCD